MSFATMARRAAAVAVLALALALPVAAAQAGASVPVTVRTDGAGSTAVYTVGITPQGTAPAPAQTSLQIKNGGTAYFTGLSFDEPGDYTYRVAQVKGSAPYTSYDARAYTVTVRVTTRPDGTLRTELYAEVAAHRKECGIRSPLVGAEPQLNGIGASCVHFRHSTAVDTTSGIKSQSIICYLG